MSDGLDAIAVSEKLGAILAKQDSLQHEIHEFKEAVGQRFEAHGRRMGDLDGEVNKLSGTMEYLRGRTGLNGGDGVWKKDTMKVGGGALGGAGIMWFIEIVKTLFQNG